MAGKRLTKRTDHHRASRMRPTSTRRPSTGSSDGSSDSSRSSSATVALANSSFRAFVKLRVVKKAATKERQGINPFTKEPMTISCEARDQEDPRYALKALKDLV